MKKKRIILLSLVLIIIFAMTGCGDGKADSQGDTQQTDENASDENVDSSAALNVENDTFTVDDLLSSVGSEETGLLTILGATEEAETYEANIFGQKATVSVTTEDGTVSAIKMDFVSVDTGSVLNAVAEQLGQDGETTDGVTTWTSGDRTVTLSEGDSGCTLEIK